MRKFQKHLPPHAIGARSLLLGPDNPVDFFSSAAEEYEAVVRGWGYNLPEVVADNLSQMVGNLANCELLDLACGDGLLGAALHARHAAAIL